MRITIIALLGLCPALALAQQFESDDVPPEGPPKPALMQGDPAIAAGLAWLVKTQDRVGKWDVDGFGKHLGGEATPGPGKLAWADPGVTSLALLALLGSGNNHRRGRYKTAAKHALRYLMKIQNADGRIGAMRIGSHLFNHAIASAALCEAYAQTKSPLVRGAATKSIEYLLGSRTPGAGWRYRTGDGESDVAATAWAVLAIHKAKQAGIAVPDYAKAKRELSALLLSWTSKTTGAVGYKARATGDRPTSYRRHDGLDSSDTHLKTHAPTAMGTVCRKLLGASAEDLAPGTRLLAAHPPRYGGPAEGKLGEEDAIYSTFGAMLMAGPREDREGSWRRTLGTLIAAQSKQGALAGSWHPVGAWGPAGGRVMTTALHVLTLQTWRRQLRAEAKQAKAPPK